MAKGVALGVCHAAGSRNTEHCQHCFFGGGEVRAVSGKAHGPQDLWESTEEHIVTVEHVY